MPAPPFDCFLKEWVKIWISSKYILIACWTVFYTRWDHDASGPYVCLAQAFPVSEIIPCIGMLQHGNMLTGNWGENRSDSRVWGMGVASCLRKEACVTTALTHRNWHSFCPLYPPLAHPPASNLVEVLHSKLPAESLHFSAYLLLSFACSRLRINLCLPNYLLLQLFVFHKQSHALLMSWEIKCLQTFQLAN